MNLLTVEKISKIYGEKVLFDKVTLGIDEKDKIGVIGINGTGKSTLLKIIAGFIEPDEGVVTKGRSVRIAYLDQNPEFDLELNILENVLLDKKDDDYIYLEGQAKTMLQALGIEDYDGTITTLSGGQKKRVALARTLLSPADILILDEPTNHLDDEMTEWLEEYLKMLHVSIIMVTHDRYFLDRVTNKIVEIDKGSIYSYVANYSKYLELKAIREEMELATERKNQSLYRKDLEWMMRGARARSTKQKAHIQRFEALRDRKQIEKDKDIEISTVSSRLGKKTVEINHISKSFDDRILIDDFSYILLKNDRIGIVGPNGCGKSTLLNIITGNLLPDKGYIESGETVKISYFSQETIFLDGNIRVIDYIKEIAEFLHTSDGLISASSMLDKFLFPPTMQYAPISKLSGGEKRRLYLLKILMESPNVLVLDEPTNDLDIKTLSILENYLDNFDGIVITVSHDRYFLDRIVNRIFAFEENGKILQYEGGFTDYKERKAKEGKINNNDNSNSSKSKRIIKTEEKPKTKKIKFSYNEAQEFEVIDSVISDLEERIEELEIQMNEAATDYSRLSELTQNMNKLKKELEEKMDRWVYLNELAEEIEINRNL